LPAIIEAAALLIHLVGGGVAAQRLKGVRLDACGAGGEGLAGRPMPALVRPIMKWLDVGLTLVYSSHG